MNINTFEYFGSMVNNVDIIILEHGILNGDDNWKHYNVNSPFNRLYFVLDGEGYLENSEKKIILSKDSAYLIPSHSIYNYICDSSITKFYIHFRVELFSSFDIFESVEECMIRPFNKDEIEKFLEKAKSKNIEDVIDSKAFLLKEISKFIGALNLYLEEKIGNARKYEKVYEYIKNNCVLGITLKDLAQYANMGISSMTKGFKKDTGGTLKDYIDKKILLRAKEYLILTDMNIKEIAYVLKFTDEFYFSRFFKRHNRISPREYRIKNKI